MKNKFDSFIGLIIDCFIAIIGVPVLNCLIYIETINIWCKEQYYKFNKIPYVKRRDKFGYIVMRTDK